MAQEQKKIPAHPYPLTRRIRLTIMLSLIGAFLVITPPLLFYAQGFTFDFPSKKFIHGGALSIETSPTGTHLFLNNIKISSPEPFRLSHLLPGNYHVKIEKEGYYSWERDITILSNQTTYLHDIDLFRIQKPILLNNALNDILTLNGWQKDDSIVLERKKENNYEFFFYNTITQKETPITHFYSTTTLESEWSPNYQLLKIESFTNSEKNIVLLNPLSPLTSQTFALPKHANPQWGDGGFSDSLLVQDGKEIRQMNLNTTKSLFSLSTTNSLWFVEPQNTIWEFEDNIFRRYRGEKNILTAGTGKIITQIIDANENRIIGRSSNGLIIFHIENGSIVQEEEIPATEFLFYRDQNYYLAWYQGELRSISYEGNVTLINRFSSDIQSIQPLTPSGTLLILTQNTFLTFHPKYYLTHELLKTDHVQSFAVNQKKREIYFEGSIDKTNGLWKIKY